MTTANPTKTATNLPRREPAVDVYETESAIDLVLDAPGLRPEDLDVHVEDRVLTIRGARTVHAPDGAKVHVRELHSAEWFRQFRIGEDIDAGTIEADLQDGVLRLRLPKVDRRQRIEIRGA